MISKEQIKLFETLKNKIETVGLVVSEFNGVPAACVVLEMKGAIKPLAVIIDDDLFPFLKDPKAVTEEADSKPKKKLELIPIGIMSFMSNTRRILH